MPPREPVGYRIVPAIAVPKAGNRQTRAHIGCCRGVEAMGGRLEVEDTPGGGLTVVARLQAVS
jgi:hypothetical protein